MKNSLILIFIENLKIEDINPHSLGIENKNKILFMIKKMKIFFVKIQNIRT